MSAASAAAIARASRSLNTIKADRASAIRLEQALDATLTWRLARLAQIIDGLALER
jgi:hypothetical protein